MGCDLHKKDDLKMKEYNKTRNTIFDNEGLGNNNDILHHECQRARAAGMLDKAMDYIRRYFNEIVPGFEDKYVLTGKPDNKEFMEEDATKKLIIFRKYLEDEAEEMRKKVMLATRRLKDEFDCDDIYAADIEDEIHNMVTAYRKTN